MTEMDSVLEQLGFNQTRYVENRGSIADLFKPNKRCGIYVLQCGNGELYVGQAVDVTRRYVQHLRTHGEIHKLSFKRVNRNALNEAERDAIWTLESQGFTLRNITFTSAPQGDADFDLLMTAAQQSEWLSDRTYIDGEGDRPVNPELRHKYSTRFEKFQRHRHGVAATTVLRQYVRRGIPAIKRGEISIWACSCLPGFHRPSVTILSRINVYWQEVFTVSEFEGDLWFSIHLALSPLQQAFGASLKGLQRRHRDVEIIGHAYAPGGVDQTSIEVKGEAMALQLLNDDDVLSAIRLFNLRLMKKGACTFGRYHCLDLADRIIDADS